MKKKLTISLSILMLGLTSLNAQNLNMVNGQSTDFGFDFNASTGVVSNLFFTFGEDEGIAINDEFTISWGIQSDINDFGTYIEIDRQVFTAGINGYSSFLLNNWSSQNLNDNLGIDDGNYFLVGIVDTEDDIFETNETQANNGMLLASDASETISFTRGGALSAASVTHENLYVNTTPNPFQNILNIDLSTINSGVVEVQLLDLTGKVVLNSTVRSSANVGQRIQLNTSGLLSGLYILRIKTNEGVTTRKLLKK